MLLFTGVLSVTREIEASLAARLCRAGAPKSSVVEAFKLSVENGYSFIEELYASERIHDVWVARSIADEAGVAFEQISANVQVVLPTVAQFTALSTLRHAIVLTAEETTLIYIVPTMQDIAVIKANLPESPDIAARLRITTPTCLAEFMRSSHEGLLVEGAIRMVEITSSEHSARIVTTGSQGALIGLLLSSALFTVMLRPEWLWSALHIVFSLSFSACILLRLLACNSAGSAVARALQTVSPAELPNYSVMVALYREADIVPQLVRAMEELNWPRSKLEVLFLCEADDLETIATLQWHKLPPGFRVIPIPGSGPRTKPKALNYGLQLVKGDYVVVYDAEDRPHRDQLLEAWGRFNAGEDDLGCLQAPLIIANSHEGPLARLFAFEYAAHFRGLLPWLARRRSVLPLGGSSNHFRRSCLEAVGGWDPFNVTEDAELGTRLARCGFHIDMLALPTIEDAPTDTGVWLRQRTRWLKGWMQTWLVEMRNPLLLVKQLGTLRFVIYHLLTTGMIASALLYPLMLVFIVITTFHLTFADAAMSPAIPILDLCNILMGYLSFHVLGRCVLRREDMSGMVLPWIPLYWLLISVAAWRALWQLQTDPFLWEKTPHLPSRQAYEAPIRSKNCAR